MDLLIGTESHLDISIQDSEIIPKHFNTYRKDRNRFGGGVLVLVKNTLSSSQIDIQSSIEIIWVHFHASKGSDIIVGSFYRPPHSADSVLDGLMSSILSIKEKFPRAQIILGGDFNSPGIDWEHGTLIDSYAPCYLREKLISISQDTLMFQMVTFPTRAQNILDLCFTTHPDTVLTCEPTPGLSDHDAVLINFQTLLHVIKQNPRKIYLYKKADWDKIREKLSNISDVYFNLNSTSPHSVDENWSFFSKNFQQILNDHVPTKTLSRRTHLPWMSAPLKRLIRKKQRVYNKARLSCREADWLQYKALKREVKHMLKSQHKNYLMDMISSPNNKKPLWHYIKAQRQEHTGISTLKDPTSGHTITDPAEKANALNEHFKSVFTVEDNETVPNKGISLYPSLPDFEIITQGVYNILSNCSPYKSPGPDCIHPYALKATATEYLLC